jgi:predicted amidohydrolase
MVLDPYGQIIAETAKPGDDMVVADLDASLLPTSSGRRWLRARRPELYDSLTRRTGQEVETRRVRFGMDGT